MSIEHVREIINKLKFHSQELNKEISMLKENDISAKFYLIGMQKMALQALDLSNAIEKQTSFFTNQKRAAITRQLFKQKQEQIEKARQERKQRREHGTSMV
ncbi:MAG: hypothetical protein PHF86_06630 [Candidatus Nanoarchaeia archaeon]|jgi:replicative superfamily II helicase|nr:hypothetical protein [Candidatus Nanoarchaeia archaeon]